MTSVLEIYDVASGQVRALFTTTRHIEAPNFYPDGKAVMVNADGRLYRVPLKLPALHEVPTGAAIKCNNDHGISPDGKWLALSSHHEGEGSQIYLMPLSGGALQRITPAAPSWWHGWSPDSAWITYPAARGGSRILDIYKLEVSTGHETRLTDGRGHHDGSDYAPDGKSIYYNCDSTGQAQIWTVGVDGKHATRLFADEYVNWFPHPSPDGKHLIYLAYPPGTTGHPANLPVAIVLCNPDGTDRRRIVEFNGGQGTMNVPNWSPDGASFAYVRYEPES